LVAAPNAGEPALNVNKLVNFFVCLGIALAEIVDCMHGLTKQRECALQPLNSCGGLRVCSRPST